MKTKNFAGALPAVLIACVLAGCAAQKVTTPKMTVYPPPYVPIDAARETIVPSSQFMKLAILNFVDQTGRSGPLVEALADVLSTELHKSGRFEIYDRGHLRQYDFTQVLDQCKKSKGECSAGGEKCCGNGYEFHAQKAEAEFNKIQAATDAFMLAAVTSIAPSQVAFDYRIVNSQSYTVLVSGSAILPYEMNAGTVRVDRSAATRIANDIRSALPATSIGRRAKVMVRDGQVLTISLGRKDGIIPGLNVFVVAPGKGGGDNPNVVDEVYLAQAYVVSVYDNTSQVVVFFGKDYRVGDDVRFK